MHKNAKHIHNDNPCYKSSDFFFRRDSTNLNMMMLKEVYHQLQTSQPRIVKDLLKRKAQNLRMMNQRKSS